MVIRLGVLVPIVGLAGCVETPPPKCGEFDQVFVWRDGDADGFGGEEAIGYVCEAGPGEASNNADCDDTNAAIFPDATGANEVCDLVDNDCDDRVDELSPKVPWYNDADADGFGSNVDIQFACERPGSAWRPAPGDCDDTAAAVSPAAIEICNGGIDDDCDTLADDADGGVDPTTYTRYYLDGDGDTYGNDLQYVDRCAAVGSAVLAHGDCNDSNPAISPAGTEVCDPPGVDEDCDTLLDDLDTIDPADPGLEQFFADADGDGYGDPLAITAACVASPGIGVTNDDDCDDSDPLANIPQDWYEDVDGDGVGDGIVAVAGACTNPGGGLVPASAGIDCEPSDPNVYPGALDECGDGLDTDCSGADDCGSCKSFLDGDPASPSGVYTIEPFPGFPTDVYCDMTTDGGGWTLVASTRNTTLDDAGTNTGYADLQTLVPASGHTEIWKGLRDVVLAAEPVGGRSDIRFACKVNAGSPTFDVDLSFYDIHWYREITTGTDLQSCFSENNGVGADPPPERRNNLTGAVLMAGNQWGAGYLEGEDSCSDSGDFTVDFDDRGMDNNQADGTDWGEDDSSQKCGVTTGTAWFVFVREL